MLQTCGVIHSDDERDFSPHQHFIFVFNICLEALKGTKYCCVLINIILADINNTTAMAMFYSYYDFVLANYMHREPEVRIPVSVSILISNHISLRVFVVANIEKSFAICKPFAYQSSVLVRWLPLNIVTVWLYILSLGTIVSLINALNLIPGMSNLRISFLNNNLCCRSQSRIQHSDHQGLQRVEDNEKMI